MYYRTVSHLLSESWTSRKPSANHLVWYHGVGGKHRCMAWCGWHHQHTQRSSARQLSGRAFCYIQQTNEYMMKHWFGYTVGLSLYLCMTQFNPSAPLDSEAHSYRKSPALKDRIHCVVYVMDACKISIMPTKLEKKLETIRRKVNLMG